MSDNYVSQDERLNLLQALAQFEEHIKSIPSVPFAKTCANCMSYDHDKEICIHYKAKPPCQVIVKGCDEWMDDIPF